MLGFGFVGFLLAFAALAFLEVGSDDSYNDREEDTPPDPDEEAADPNEEPEDRGQDGPGDDLITARDDVSVYNGFAGNDTLIGFPEFGVQLNGGAGDDLLIALEDDHAFGGEGDDFLIGEHMDPGSTVQILRGGGGSDTIVSAGGSEMTGGAGEDVFVISLGGLDLTGAMQSIGGEALSTPVIRDFNPSEDSLVLDLNREFMSAFDDLPQDQYGPNERSPLFFGDTVTLTAERTSDDTGILIRVDGLPMVELEGFDGTDPSELLAAISVEVNGASVSDAESGGGSGLTEEEDAEGNVTLVLTDAFQGGGNYIGGDRFSTLDLSALSADMRVTVAEGDIITIEPADGSLLPTTFEGIDRVILGNGDDVFDGADGSGFIEVVAGNGEDRILASDSGIQNSLRGEGFMRAEGDGEVIDGTGATVLIGGSGNDILSGGLGDTLTGGARSDVFVIYGVGDEGAGPARITDFNPLTNDNLLYVPVNPDGSNDPHDIIIQVDDFSTSIIDNGEVVVFIQDIGRFYDPSITILDPVTSLPV
ncbi:hypothetical protein [Roseinatronobacter domitianus]|uniref:hypothetical protein n=1 Tax=Roseinatronobacter domitianus TaxID=2940293 RepID=UPI0024B34792|nr:hypothetical protein [Roseibaca domitiana]